MSVMAIENGPGAKVNSRNAEAELLDDLKARGYELWVEDGRLKFRGPPATPVIEQAMRANVRGLKRLLDKSVTTVDDTDVSIVNSHNAQVELIKNRNDKRLFHKLVAPAVEEAKRDFAQAGVVVKRQQGAGEFSDPGEGLWRVLEEYSKHTPPEVREARRLARLSRKTAEVCGFCGRDIEDGEPVHFGVKACTGIAVLFGTGPKYEDTVACEECAPAYRKREAKDRSYLSRFAEMTCVTCNRTVVVKKSGRGARRRALPIPDKPGRYQAAAFCCERCQWTFYNTERNERAARTREKTCEACGEAFTATRSDAKTCSPACKQKACRQRKNGDAP